VIHAWVQYAKRSQDEHSRMMRLEFDVRISQEAIANADGISDIADACAEAVRISFQDEKAQALQVSQLLRSER
jgi:hypothetical protein